MLTTSKCLERWGKWTDLSSSWCNCFGFEQEVLLHPISGFNVWPRDTAPTNRRGVRGNEWTISWEGRVNKKVKTPWWQVTENPTQTGLGHLYLTSPLASGMAGSKGSKVSRLISLYLFTVELYIGMVLLRCGTFTSSSSITSCSLLKPAGACCSISLAVPLTWIGLNSLLSEWGHVQSCHCDQRGKVDWQV